MSDYEGMERWRGWRVIRDVNCHHFQSRRGERAANEKELIQPIYFTNHQIPFRYLPAAGGFASSTTNPKRYFGENPEKFYAIKMELS